MLSSSYVGSYDCGCAVVIGAIAEPRSRGYDRRMHWFASLVVRSEGCFEQSFSPMMLVSR